MTDDYRIALRPDDPDDPSDIPLLDDIVVNHVSMFRAELMSDTELWMCCYFPDTDQHLTLAVRATKRRGQKMRLEVRATDMPNNLTYEDN